MIKFRPNKEPLLATDYLCWWLIKKRRFINSKIEQLDKEIGKTKAITLLGEEAKGFFSHINQLIEQDRVDDSWFKSNKFIPTYIYMNSMHFSSQTFKSKANTLDIKLTEITEALEEARKQNDILKASVDASKGINQVVKDKDTAYKSLEKIKSDLELKVKELEKNLQELPSLKTKLKAARDELFQLRVDTNQENFIQTVVNHPVFNGIFITLFILANITVSLSKHFKNAYPDSNLTDVTKLIAFILTSLCVGFIMVWVSNNKLTQKSFEFVNEKWREIVTAIANGLILTGYMLYDWVAWLAINEFDFKIAPQWLIEFIISLFLPLSIALVASVNKSVIKLELNIVIQKFTDVVQDTKYEVKKIDEIIIDFKERIIK